MSTFQKLSFRTWLALTGVIAPFSTALAAFGGPIPAIPGTPGAADQDSIRGVIVNVLMLVLDFMALAAVVFVVIAGIRLIVSGGNDEAKDKAKKIILYVIIGLLIILFARVIVGFFTSVVAEQV